MQQIKIKERQNEKIDVKFTKVIGGRQSVSHDKEYGEARPLLNIYKTVMVL